MKITTSISKKITHFIIIFKLDILGFILIFFMNCNLCIGSNKFQLHKKNNLIYESKLSVGQVLQNKKTSIHFLEKQKEDDDKMKYKFLFSNQKDSINKNSIYIEALGSGILWSLNYEKILFHKSGNSINCRIGYGYLPINGNFHVFPLLINYQTNLNKSLSFEIGVGVRYINAQHGFEHPYYDNTVDIIGNAGFRFLIIKHLLLKIDLTPQFTSKEIIIGVHGNPMIYFGFSLGYSFGKK